MRPHPLPRIPDFCPPVASQEQLLTSDSTTGLYKVGNGEDISKAPAPGMFDLKVRPTPETPVANARGKRY